MRVEHIADAAIESLHHPIGLWRSGLSQAVLNAQGFAQLVKLMVAAWLTLTASQLELDLPRSHGQFRGS